MKIYLRKRPQTATGINEKASASQLQSLCNLNRNPLSKHGNPTHSQIANPKTLKIKTKYKTNLQHIEFQQNTQTQKLPIFNSQKLIPCIHSSIMYTKIAGKRELQDNENYER